MSTLVMFACHRREPGPTMRVRRRLLRRNAPIENLKRVNVCPRIGLAFWLQVEWLHRRAESRSDYAAAVTAPHEHSG